MKAWIKLKTLARLGVLNVLRVVLYRVSLRIPWSRIRRITAPVSTPPFFKEPDRKVDDVPPREGWWRYAEAFGIAKPEIDVMTVDWHQNLIDGRRASDTNEWFRLDDFDEEQGDIKGIWEASRMDWSLVCAQHALSGNAEGVARINALLEDWCNKNPPYRGVNWKCGQEASIRVMHLAMTALMLQQSRKACPGLLQLIETHLKRIAPTTKYAIAQDNNHGTSEAAALYIGGSLLQKNGIRSADKWSILGRRLLEERTSRLIMDDGSFSQYSTNYHRLMLDTLSMVECWRRHMDMPRLNDQFYHKAQVATSWLGNRIAGKEGQVPNYGANDGARLLPLTDTNYSDYRPSVQLASVMFHHCSAFSEKGEWDYPLVWLDIERPDDLISYDRTAFYPYGGYSVLRFGELKAVFNYPRYRFRPSHSDLLHVDLWWKGENIFLDSGSYSYNAEGEWQEYFRSQKAHNTVEFDNRNAMPRLGRFLFGGWPKAENVGKPSFKNKIMSCCAEYRDYCDAFHCRKVSLTDGIMTVCDVIDGFKNFAILRWRLKKGDWKRISENAISNGKVTVTINSSSEPVRFEIVPGWISRHYSTKEEIPVLEVEVGEASNIETQVTFSS